MKVSSNKLIWTESAAELVAECPSTPIESGFESGNGNLQDFRCFASNITCGQDLLSIGTKTGCTERATSYLEPLQTYVNFFETVRPELAEHGIRIISCEESTAPQKEIGRRFREQIFPVLTPLAIGPGRPKAATSRPLFRFTIRTFPLPRSMTNIYVCAASREMSSCKAQCNKCVTV